MSVSIVRFREAKIGEERRKRREGRIRKEVGKGEGGGSILFCVEGGCTEHL